MELKHVRFSALAVWSHQKETEYIYNAKFRVKQCGLHIQKGGGHLDMQVCTCLNTGFEIYPNHVLVMMQKSLH